MRSSSFRASEGRILLCAKKLIVLQGESVVRLRLPTILVFRISHSLSRFEGVLQARTDETLPALTAGLPEKPRRRPWLRIAALLLLPVPTYSRPVPSWSDRLPDRCESFHSSANPHSRGEDHSQLCERTGFVVDRVFTPIYIQLNG
jgi:hypothetical protein